MGPKYKKNQNDAFIQEIFACFRETEVFDASVETDQSAMTYLSQTEADNGFVSAFDLDGENEGKNLAKWLDKTVKYFRDMSHKTTGDEKEALESVCEKLTDASAFLTELGRHLSSSGNNSRMSEQNWNDLFEEVSSIRTLSDDLAAFNRKTGFKYADAPAMMAAQGIGRAASRMGSLVDRQVLKDHIDTYAELTDSYVGRRDEMEASFQRFLNDCEEKAVPADKVETLGSSLDEKIRKNEQKLKALPEVDGKLKGIIERTKNGPLEVLEDRALELQMMIAFKKNSDAGSARNRETKALRDLEKLLDESYINSENVLVTRYEHLSMRLRYMLRGAEVLDYVNDISRKPEISDDEKKKMAQAMYNYDQIMASSSNSSRNRAAKGEFSYELLGSKELAKMVSTAYDEIRDEFSKSSEAPIFEGRMRAHKMIRETTKKQDAYQKEYNETRKTVNSAIKKLQDFRSNTPVVRASVGTDEMWDWLDDHAYNLDVAKAEKELNETKVRIEEMRKSPVNAEQNAKIGLLENLGKQTSELTERMTEAEPKLLDLSKTVNDLRTGQNDLKNRYDALKADGTPVEAAGQNAATVRQFTAAYKDKARKLIDRFDDNKRFFHKNSEEYTAMKTALENYIADPKKGTMEAVQSAAAHYIQMKKDGFHLSKTTSMRGTRLAYAREILDFAKEAGVSYDRCRAEDERFFDTNTRFNGSRLTEEYGTFLAAQRPDDYREAEQKFDRKLSDIEKPVNDIVKTQKETIKDLKAANVQNKVRVEAVESGEKELEALLG